MKGSIRTVAPVIAITALLSVAAGSSPVVVAPHHPASAVPGDAAGGLPPDPLQAAFRFASAIEVDPNDQAMAQQEVVADLIDAGRLQEAGDGAARIKGWRKGAALADVARAWAGAGRDDRARQLLDEAETVRRSTSDWGGPRIAAHMAQAYAALGDVERSTRIAGDLARDDPRQYGGRAVAAIATGLARKGDFTAAMARLAALDQERDFDTVWWRTMGYLDLARRTDLPAARRSEATRAARRSAEGVAGWKRGEALTAIGREAVRQVGAQGGREALVAAEAIIAPLPPTLPNKPALMSDLARAWGLQGDKARARSLLEKAAGEVPAAAVIDRPGAWAAIAGARREIGDAGAAQSLYDRALSEAAALVNARPRALAVVDICRSLGRAGVDPEPDQRARLDALLAGLRDPW